MAIMEATMDDGHDWRDYAGLNGHQEPDKQGLDLVDWADAFARTHSDTPVVDDLMFAGRWTALVAPAKGGKSALALHVAVSLATGTDPFTADRRDPLPVLYVDAEMGRVDFVDRLEARSLAAADLGKLAYCDLPPRLNVVQGAELLRATVAGSGCQAVVIDGLNGVIQGAEKDDVPWRDLYDLCVAPLKRAGVALLTCDNHGKDRTLGPRGSSVKLDKADAIMLLERTDDGVKLTTDRRRSAAYAKEIVLEVTLDDQEEPIDYRYSSLWWPAGTKEKAQELDDAGVPLNAGRPTARKMLQAAGKTPGKNAVVSAALHYRRMSHMQIANVARAQFGNVADTAGTGGHKGGQRTSVRQGQVAGTAEGKKAL